MTRYVTRAAFVQYHSESWSTITASDCVEADKTPQWSGLLDHEGNKLYRQPETVPLGFAIGSKEPSK